jgi:divalent metal cation (Fe/Co/Zn/Cd) transporter
VSVANTQRAQANGAADAGDCRKPCWPSASAAGGEVDATWLQAARWAKTLAWASLLWMCAEGAVGVWQGLAVGSIALTGWGFGSAVEGVASLIVVWRFSGPRALSEIAEQRARKAVAVSFWLLAPYIAAGAIRDLTTHHHAATTATGMAVAGSSLLLMPALGRAKQRLADRLDSGATAGEGAQNYLCAAQAAAVLTGLAITAAWPGGWWIDPVIALGIAAWSVREGIESWRGEDCC